MTRIRSLLLGVSFILWGVCRIECASLGTHAGLYSDTEDVYEVIDEDDFTVFQYDLVDTNMPALVVYYSDSCSHCVHYKPRFSHLAKVLAGTMKAGAINCAEPDLRSACSTIGLYSVPTVLIFSPTGRMNPVVDANEKKYGDRVVLPPRPNEYYYDDEDDAEEDNQERGTLYRLEVPSGSIAVDAVMKYVQKRLDVTLSNDQTVALNKSVSETLLNKRAENKRCSSQRWPTKEDEFSKRIYDAILGLKYMLTNWIITESDLISAEEIGKIMKFVELNRLLIPVKEVRYALSHLLVFLMPYGVHSTPLPNQEYQSFLSKHIFADFITVNVKARNGHLPFLHCKTIPCSIWQLLHILAESMQWHTSYLLNDETHCGGNIRIKGDVLNSILPVHIYNQSINNVFNYESAIDYAVEYTIPEDSVLFDTRHLIHIKRALRIGEMDIKQVLNVSPEIGCQVYHPYTALKIIKQFFDRFFQCTECRTHFDENVKMNVFNLEAINPSEEILSDLTNQASQDMDHSDQKLVSIEMYKSLEYPKYSTYRLWLWRLHNSVTERLSVAQTISKLQGYSGYKDYAYCSVYWPGEIITDNIINEDILRDAIMEYLSNPEETAKNIPERLEGVDLDRVSKLLTSTYWDHQAL